MGTAMEKSLYSHFADLLEYPREDIKLKAEECYKALASRTEYPPDILEELTKFKKDLEHMPLDDLQGVYSYTFELTTDFTLDMGYHLFDGFKRASNMSSIKSMYSAQGFPVEEVAKGELPDHLPVLLKFLAFLKDEELKKNFRESFVILALERLNKNFERNRKNIYFHLINVVYRVMDRDVKEVK